MESVHHRSSYNPNFEFSFLTDSTATFYETASNYPTVGRILVEEKEEIMHVVMDSLLGEETYTTVSSYSLMSYANLSSFDYKQNGAILQMKGLEDDGYLGWEILECSGTHMRIRTIR